MLGRTFHNSGDPSTPASEASEPEMGAHLCMLAVASPKGITAGSLETTWKTLFPKISIKITERAKDSITVETDGVVVVMMAIPLPIPAGDVESACERSWMWPQAAASMAKQKAHLIIAAVPAGNAVKEALAISRVTAAFCKAGAPVGVYWGAAGAVHAPDSFIEITRAYDKFGLLPATLWVNTLISAKNPKGPFTLTTDGLREFGHRELEIIDERTLAADTLRTTVYEVILYLLEKGPVLKHGETFGRSAEEKWKVEFAASRFRKGEPIIRLHIP